jgi:glycosyltransferase involved in cell wall biosynthesis
VEAAEFCADLDDVIFVVAGRNDLRGEAATQFDKYRGLKNLRIVEGHVPFEDVQLYFAGTDLVAAPYREGTTSGVYRLGVAFGRPVVATEIGDLRESIARGTAFSLGTGPDVPKRLAQFVRQHRNDLSAYAADALRRMGQEAVENSWPGVAERYLAFLTHNALRGRDPRAEGVATK